MLELSVQFFDPLGVLAKLLLHLVKLLLYLANLLLNRDMLECLRLGFP